MLLNKDMMNSGWLAVIRPIVFFLLLIGECTAQEIYTGLVGMKRNHIQVMMKNESFIDYQKSHVTYRLSPEIKQTVLYSSDTCKAFYWSVAQGSAAGFESQLKIKGLSKSDYKKSENLTDQNSQVIFLVDRMIATSTETAQSEKTVSRGGNAGKVKPGNRRPMSTVEFKASQLPPKEARIKTNWDSVNSVKVLGWEVDQ